MRQVRCGVNWIAGYLYDGWNSLRFAAQEMGKAIDRAMDVWGENDDVA